MGPFQFFGALSLQVLDQKYFDVPRCLRPTNLTEFCLDVSATKSLLLMILTESQIPFLLHLESYLVYEKGHQVGHCHQLCLLLVHFCCQYLEASLERM